MGPCAHGTLRLIDPGKPNQNAYIESCNGRFRDECLNEQWFLNLAHAQAVIEAMGVSTTRTAKDGIAQTNVRPKTENTTRSLG